MVKEAIKERPAQSSIRLFLAKVLRWLIEPAADVEEKDRQKLKLLTAFLLLITIHSLSGAIVARGIGVDAWFNMLVISVVFAVGYGLSRSRYYQPALVIALSAPAINVIGVVISGADSIGIMQSLPWLVLPFLLASIFLARLTTVIVATSYLVFLAVLLPFTAVSPEYIGQTLAFFLMVFVLVIAIAVILQQEQSRVDIELAKRVKAENELRINEERFRLLADNASDMIIRLQLSPTFKTDYVSPSSRRITGYAPEEFYAAPELGMNIVHPEDRQLFTDYADLKKSGYRPVTLRLIRKDGAVIWAEQVFTPIYDKSGRPIAVHAISRDVTERKMMEQALIESTERLRALSEESPVMICNIDLEGNFQYVNKKFEEVTKYSREKILGENGFKMGIFQEEAFPFLKERRKAKIKSAPSYPIEVQFVCQDGELIWISMMAEPIRANNAPVGLHIIAQDITERKKAESALKCQRELIDQIIATIPNAVMVIDKAMKVLLANDTFYKNFGLQKAGVENKPISEIIEAEELMQAISSTIKGNKKSLSLEFRYQLKGVPRIFTATIVRMQNNRYLILLSDVTEARERRERLYLTNRLASVGELASGVAHELNNPLTSIICLSGLLAKQDTLAETKEDLVAINSEAQRCAAIVKNLLAFARKHVAKREPLPVAKIVEDVLKLRAYEHRSQNVTVETDFPDDLPEVLADYFQLQQVFLNIIINAEKAMVDANGQGILRITGEKTDGTIRISFSDDGPGIANEHLGLIFNPFFTTKEVGQGTGLGLSICYGIVAAHGGKIYAKNNNDKGATFVVELPVIGN